MRVLAYMERGTNKACSEDTMVANSQICKDGYFSFAAPGNCVAVADGVGGNAGGQEASEFVTNALKAGIIGDIKEAALRINEELISYAKTIPGKEQMATTLTALLFNDEKPTCVLHVGNTRLSAIQGKYLKQITRDHTTVEFLRSRGDFDAADNAIQSEITSCFGTGITAAINQLQVYEIDKSYAGFVITSDGLHDYIDEEVIEDFAASGMFFEDNFKSLARQARGNGSADDISIIVVKLWE